MSVYDRLDHILSLDAGFRGVDQLFEAARDLAGESLVLRAARLLADVPPGSNVLITTGSVSRTWTSPSIGENDGPPGAAVIARALAIARGAVSHVVAEESLMASMGPVFSRAGMSLVTRERAAAYRRDHGALAMAVMTPMTTEDDDAVRAATDLLDALNPALVVSAERAGRNERGVYHNARGMDYGQGRARADVVVEQAQDRSIPVVAIGDGGNEIGMALIADRVREVVPFGAECVCGCGGGMGSAQTADALIVAGCSNWGCYGLVAALAVLESDPRLLHTPALEGALLDVASTSGLIDSSTGLASDGVDGLPRAVHVAVVSLLQEVARAQIGVGS